MHERIVAALEQIERMEGVKVLFAVESGSRVWGFHSVNSDYDVRFVYVRQPAWYLSAFDKRDVVEYPLTPDNLDISGWDLRKACQLLYKSNPSLLEWFKSPTVYIETPTAQAFRALGTHYFNARTALYHYISMAKSNYMSYIQNREQVILKKYLYVVRPILCCQWIMRSHSQPPTEFDDLEHSLKWSQAPNYPDAAISDLLARKKAGEELDKGEPVHTLNLWIEDQLRQYEANARLANIKEVDTGLVDSYFLHVTLNTQFDGKRYP